MMRSRLASALVVAFVLLGWPAQSAPAANADQDTPDRAAAADPPGEGGDHGGHGKHGGGEIDPLAFQGDLALWTGVVFLLLMLVLWPFWTKIAAGLEKREEGIADQIAQAEAANQQAKDLLVQYEQKLDGAKDDVREMMARARQDAEQAGREMLDRAKAEAEAEHQRALREIDAAAASAMKDLADRSASLAVDLAGRIVGATLERADHAQLIEQAMGNLARQEPSSN